MKKSHSELLGITCNFKRKETFCPHVNEPQAQNIFSWYNSKRTIEGYLNYQATLKRVGMMKLKPEARPSRTSAITRQLAPRTSRDTLHNPKRTRPTVLPWTHITHSSIPTAEPHLAIIVNLDHTLQNPTVYASHSKKNK